MIVPDRSNYFGHRSNSLKEPFQVQMCLRTWYIVIYDRFIIQLSTFKVVPVLFKVVPPISVIVPTTKIIVPLRPKHCSRSKNALSWTNHCGSWLLNSSFSCLLYQLERPFKLHKIIVPDPFHDRSGLWSFVETVPIIYCSFVSSKHRFFVHVFYSRETS